MVDTGLEFLKIGGHDMTNPEAEQSKPTYRIGAVSRLTGVAPDTLRVWERRYGAVVPFRSEAGSRLYSQADVTRLALMKHLVDRGEAISSVANLSVEELKERAKGAPLPQLAADLERPCRVAVLGSSLPHRLAGETAADKGLEWSGLYSEKAQFLVEAPGLKADVAVLEYSSIQHDQIREIGMILTRSCAAYGVIVYGFATQATLERLESPQVTLVRGPVDRFELRRLCLALYARPTLAPPLPAHAGVEVSGALPARRFDAATLTNIAESPVGVRCECPHHLAELISRLSAFETYSEECEVRNVGDAALHAFLQTITAQARALMEKALARVIEADGIEV